ncbi:serine/threonine-protein kinase [Mycolicibacterium arenosum]|uniref:non-specific serine/threonine protein kinase n=1 Tax=Mycolicibacterium arenosum TaxID=2952157 RepID=A0ABT1M9H5_9MYCO|nr:serine/threonine-protein kinase [Mycolicibacterium sp. CAU 1645]MCP9275823.1 serine/threonine protein kinase [Mycolicibacterium sp. CAU 1645]
MPLAEGQEIAGYTVLRSLGAGGMGEVYLAQHPRLPRQDALKVLATAVCADSEYRERFNREADIAATLWHPHIVEVHDRGDVEGRLWIAMDYVDGTDAGQLLADEYPDGMPAEQVVRLVTAVAEALDYAHGKGLTHRDVKPANILIAEPGTSNERILLADFGIARRSDDTSNLTGTNMTVGTVIYAAPEQLCGDTVDGRADQYALAATAYQLLTGVPPFQHSNPAVVISQHLTAAPPPIGDRKPELAGLGPVFEKALAKVPDERFGKCVDFARALAHGVGVTPGSGGGDATMLAMPASGPRHARAQAARRRRPAIVVVAVALGVLLLALGSVIVIDRSRQRAQDADAPRPPTTSAAPTTTEPGISLPVVAIGATCATEGAAGITEDYKPAFCSRLPGNGATVWSLYPGEVASPTITPGPDDEVYPPETETPVLVCMEQTGQSRLDCHDDIVSGNATPAPTPAS